MATNYNSSNIADLGLIIAEASAGSQLDMIKNALAADVAKVTSAVVSSGTVNVNLVNGASLVAQDGASGLGSTAVDVLFLNPADNPSPVNLSLNSAQAAELNLILVDQSATENVSLTVNSADFRGSVILGDGNDSVNLNSTRGVLVDGGDGNDSVVTGTGRDTVVVGAGSDTVFTSAGNDTITFPASWSQPSVHASVDGGFGTDTLNISAITGHAGDIATVSQINGVVTVTFGNGAVIDAKNIEAVIYADDAGTVQLVGMSTFVLAHEQPPSS